MKINNSILKFIGKTVLCGMLAFSTFGASATLGDGKMSKDRPKHVLVTPNRIATKSSVLSLQSGYAFRGNNVISVRENRYVNTNTVVSYQQGHTTYTIPLQKKAPLNGKLTFNPNVATR